MADEQNPKNPTPDEISRRDFVVSIGAGIVAASGATASAQMPVMEMNVTIKTPDGNSDAVFVHPTTGRYPGVLIWSDAFGLRPVFRDMAKRLAAQGYSVLVPNPFYRTAKAPVLTEAEMASFNFGNPEHRAKLMPLMGGLNAPGAAERDATAYVAWLDAQPQVDRTKKVGTQGYCMGGPLVMRTAATVPDRVGAVASFHGGGLVTDQPTSPHLLIPKIKARLLVAIAENDDKQQPAAKDELKKAFAAAKLPAEVEVYPAQHGWCMADAPAATGPIYNKEQAERAWGKLTALYKAALV